MDDSTLHGEMSVFPELTYRFNTIPTKISTRFSIDTDKITWNNRETILEAIFKNNKKVEGISVSYYLLYSYRNQDCAIGR